MPDKTKIVHFPQGIPGFETYHDFQFVPGEEEVFAQLISIQEEHVGFILLRPEAYFPEYLKELDIDEANIKGLNVSGDVLVDVWVVLTLNRENMSKTTANLRAPILFNTVDGIGTQVILNNDRYLSRQPLFAEENQMPCQEGVAG